MKSVRERRFRRMTKQNVKILQSKKENSEQTFSSSSGRTISDLSASHTAYTDYDNRPIKPLNQRTFQTELNQYPIDQTPTSSRLSPKSTSHGPTASIAMQIRPRTRSITRKMNIFLMESTFNAAIIFFYRTCQTSHNCNDKRSKDPDFSTEIPIEI